MRVLGRRSQIPCQRIVEMVSDYLEGSLTRSQRRRFEAHIAGCPHCTEYLTQMRATIRLTGRLTEDDLSQEAEDDFAEIYRRWRAESD
jgi:anti-sigma factor RsiW